MGCYGGVAAVDRAAARRERLLDAALAVVGAEGWAGVSVRRVCAAAGLTSRYFYESFPDRDALVLALFDAVSVEAMQLVLGAVGVSDDDALSKARAAIGAFVGLVDDDARKAQVLFAYESALSERRFETARAWAQLVAVQGREFYGMVDGAEAVIATSAAMLAGGLAQTLLDWTERGAAVEQCGSDRELRDPVRRHRRGRRGARAVPRLIPRRGSGWVDFFPPLGNFSTHPLALGHRIRRVGRFLPTPRELLDPPPGTSSATGGLSDMLRPTDARPDRAISRTAAVRRR